jgi:glycosyltransferase involved in cell wall biosynthesis
VHILFLTDNFPPETNAPATRTFEHARRWVLDGHEVTVVTCAPNFPLGRVYTGYSNRLWHFEIIEGIRVIRVWSYISANEGFLRRTLDYLSFMISGSLGAAFLVRRPSLVVATSPQFFCAIAGAMVSAFWRRPFVFELRDLWPDSIAAVGAMSEGRLMRLLRRVEYWLYHRAALIVSVTHSFRKILMQNGIPGEKIVVVRNGADLDSLSPGPRPAALEQRLGAQGKFIAAYVGTVGMAHGLQSVLDCAAIVGAQTNDILFILVGAGAELEALRENAQARDLKNVLFVGPVSKQDVVEYWRLCDVALVLLRDSPTFQHVIPSKIFEAWAVGKPVILGVAGESAQMVRDAQGGLVVQPEDSKALAHAVLRLLRNPTFANELGAAGRAAIVRDFDRDILARRMLTALEIVARTNSPAHGPPPA